MTFPGLRQQQILEWLNDARTLSVDEIAARLDVSTMTIHRDLNELARLGHVEKVHGGVVLAGQSSRTPVTSAQPCYLCDIAIPSRTAFITQGQDGEQIATCCPHCGLLMLNTSGDALLALARDFLYGRMVNASQAFYLLESDISLCCVPSVLCFASLADAERFQRGFGGEVATMMEARAFLDGRHVTSCDCH